MDNNEEKQLLEKAKMNLNNKEKVLDYVYQLEQKILEEAKIIPIYFYFCCSTINFS
mgnify:CR=1 FL=1